MTNAALHLAVDDIVDPTLIHAPILHHLLLL
jgi:hypothetical protein